MNCKQELKMTKSGAQVELKCITDNNTNVLVIVGYDGWEYKKYEQRDPANDPWNRVKTRGYQVRISMNGPAWFTNDQWAELSHRIDVAKADLWALDNTNSA